MAFAPEETARSELLFQRHIPAFARAPESYVLAEQVPARLGEMTRDAGVTDPASAKTTRV